MKKIISGARAGRLLLILFAFICAMLISAQAFSAGNPIASLTSFKGTVLIKSQGNWGVEAEEGLPLYSDDKIVTKIGTATITFNDGAVIEVKANSNLSINQGEEKGESLIQKAGGVTRQLRLLLGKMTFRTSKGSDVKTTLATTTMVCGLRGTAGTISIGADGQTYLQFTEGSGETVGDFISGIATDVPAELANLNPAQRAAFVAAAAADQAKQASEKLASGEITDADAAYAAAQAAEAAAQEAKAAAEVMLNNPDPAIQTEAAAAIVAADAAVAEAQAVQQQAIDSGATPGAAPTGEVSEIGFEAEVADYSKGDLMEDNDRRMADVYSPVISIIKEPKTITNSNAASFEFTTMDNVSKAPDIIVSYKIDSGDSITLDPPTEEELAELGGEPYVYTVDFSDLWESQHQIIITATDEEHNTSTESYIWTTDYTAPIALIPTKPADIANTSSFGFDATDTNKSAGITYEYSFDSGAWTSTAATLNLGLATDGSVDGTRTIAVKATDAAGNTGTAVSYTWTYDTVVPIFTAQTAPSASITNTNNFTFSFTATDTNPLTYYWSKDGGTNWTSTGTTFVAPSFTDGSSSLQVKTEDPAGNTTLSSAFSWTTDNTPPVLGPFSAFNDGAGITITASYANVEPGIVNYIFDGPIANTGLVDDVYTFTVTATDEADNSSPGEIFTFNVSNLEGLVYGTGSVISGYGYGGAVTVEGTLGGWETDIEGTWDGPHVGTLSLATGGATDAGYWLSLISGSINTGTGAATGTSNFTLLTTTNLSKGAGTFTGSFITDNTWTGTETGSGLVDTPLLWSGALDVESGFSFWNGEFLEFTSPIEGLIGGTTSLFTGSPAQFIGLGKYDLATINDYRLFASSIEGGGADFGIDGYFDLSFGGIRDLETGDIEAKALGLYVRPFDSGYEAGILSSGTVTGKLYEGIGIWEVPYGSGSLTAESKASLSTLPTIAEYNKSGIPITGDVEGVIEFGSMNFTIVDEEEGWGIWTSSGGGTYEGTPTTEWTATAGWEDYLGYGGYNYNIVYYTGTESSSDRFAGTVNGKWMDRYSYGTFPGQVFGVYDEGTWEVLSLGTYDEGSSFAFGGMWGEVGSLYDNSGGYLSYIGSDNGNFGILTPPAAGDAEYLAMGKYSGEILGDSLNQEVYLLNSSIWSDEILLGDGEGELIGSPGIADGYAGGFLKETAANSGDGNFNGNIALVWYDLNGNAGLLTDENASGYFYPVISMWEAQGTLNSDVRETGLIPANIYESSGYIGVSLAGSFAEGLGEIHNAGSPGYTTFLYDNTGYSDLPFGVYNLKSGSSNSYYGKPLGITTNWSADIGGYGVFGYGGYGGEYGYYLGNVAGSWSAESENGDGTIGGAFNGAYLTNTHKGIIGGPFYGLYDAYYGYGGYSSDGTWVGESVGTYEGQLLAWSESGYGGLYYNWYGSIGYGGYIEGIAGGVNFPPSDFFAMGYAEGGGYGESMLWNFFSEGAPIAGYGGYSDGYVIDVGGGFVRAPLEGYTYGELEGDIFGMYLSDAGYGGATAGLFSGPASGRNYSDLGLWKVEGSLTSKELASGLDPYYVYPQSGYMDAYLSGDFIGYGGGWIQGQNSMSTTAFFVDNTKMSSLPFGIYDVMLGYGGYNQYYNPTISTTWSGVIGGEGQFGYSYRYRPEYGYSIWDYEKGIWLATVTNGMWTPGGELTGDVGAAPGTETNDIFGYYITPYQKGNIWGKLYGVNDTYYGYGGGYWVAKSIGQFEGEPLAWSEHGYGGLYYNYYDYYYGYGGSIGYGGYIEGLAGGVNFPPSDFFAMGYTEGGGYGDSMLWNFFSEGAPITGYGGYGDGYVIDVGGGFARVPLEGDIYGELEGDIFGMYLSNTGYGGATAGLFYGPASGRQYPVDGGSIWIMESSLTSKELASGLDPYYVYPQFGYMDAYLSGGFGGYGGIQGENYNPGKTAFFVDNTKMSSLPFGIYDVMLGYGGFNQYYNPAISSTWSGVIGGNDTVFGYRYDSGYGSYVDEYGYWIATVTNGMWQPGGELTGDVGAAPGTETDDIFGYYITPFQKGNIWGKLYGINDTYYGYGGGYWVAKSIGQFEGDPLDFGGEWSHSLLYDDEGYIDWASGEYDNYIPSPGGLFGLVQLPGNYYDFLAIGDYTDLAYGGGGYGGPYIWSGSLYGDEIIDGAYGYGGVGGFTAGSWKKAYTDDNSGDMNGYAAIIYYTGYG